MLMFVLAVIGTKSFNSPQSLLSFKGLPALGSSNFRYIVLQSGFDHLSKCLTVPIEPLVNLSETIILSVNITLAPTHNFNFAGKLTVQERPILSGIDMEHVLFSISLLLSWVLKRTTSESSLPIQSSFS